MNFGARAFYSCPKQGLQRKKVTMILCVERALQASCIHATHVVTSIRIVTSHLGHLGNSKASRGMAMMSYLQFRLVSLGLFCVCVGLSKVHVRLT